VCVCVRVCVCVCGCQEIDVPEHCWPHNDRDVLGSHFVLFGKVLDHLEHGRDALDDTAVARW
jgi:hypothetical protein